MAYEHGGHYRIVSDLGNGHALTASVCEENILGGDIPPAAEENGTVQRWSVAVHDGYARLHARQDTRFAVCLFHETAHCGLSLWEDRAEDTKIDFITIDRTQNLYRIKSYSVNCREDLYLTAVDDAGSVKFDWMPWSEETGQIWKLFPCSTENFSSELTMPLNINQHYREYPKEIQKMGCALCCGVDVSAYYGFSEGNTVEYFYANYWGKNFYSWRSPCAVMKEAFFADDEALFACIKNEIDASHPMIVHGIGGGTEHWVVAYGYTGRASGAQDILVLDPYGDDHETFSGGYRTLHSAMVRCCGQNYTLSGRTKTTQAQIRESA